MVDGDKRAEFSQSADQAVIHRHEFSKIFLLFFLPVLALSAAILFSLHHFETESQLKVLANKEQDRIRLQTESINHDISAVVSDIRLLANLTKLKEALVEVSAEGGAERLARAADDFHTMSMLKKVYEQIRFIDLGGDERIRINYRAEKAEFIAQGALQFKGKRYYFQESLKLDRGQVYVSPFDLNVEHGKVQMPLNPVVRFGTPVFDDAGVKQGVIIINYHGYDLIEKFRSLNRSDPEKSLLINDQGEWIVGPYLLREEADKTFANTFVDEWLEMQSSQSGDFETENGIFFYTTVDPIPGATHPWKVVSYSSPESLEKSFESVDQRYFGIFAFIALLLAVGCFYLANIWLSRKQVRIQQELLKEEYYQAQKMEALGTFVGGIAHDFNNILTGITANLYLMKPELKGSEETRRKLDEVEEFAFSAADMIKQLLTFAKQESVEMAPVEMNSLLKNSLSFQRASIPRTVSIKDDICDEKLMIHGDSSQIQHLFINLINNARDAVSNVENAALTIRLEHFVADDDFLRKVENSRQRNFARLSVTDNGCGIPKDKVSTVFEPFYSSKQSETGTGLGLAMVFGAMQLHQGVIDVESSEGEGTTFHLYFPMMSSGQPAE